MESKRTNIIYIVITCILAFSAGILKVYGGTLTGGPMLGYAVHREAQLWLEVSADTRDVEVVYYPKNESSKKEKISMALQAGRFNKPLKVTLPLLRMNTTYAYEVFVDGKKQVFSFPTEFSTQKLWEYRSPPPDFSFLFGSCLYLNDSVYDRPGKPYGQSTDILESMQKTPSDFILWGGDNVYLREADYSSESGIRYRYSKNFSHPLLGPLRASRCNFAIWDDHDFGPNNSGKDFPLREISASVFKDYWCSTNFGGQQGGTYQLIHWSDADFFLLDNRYFRSANELDSSSGFNKDFLGQTQLEWLTNALENSGASIKFIVCGSQVVNPMNPEECYHHYKKEYTQLMQFIAHSGIPGIVFLTGDRHFSEIIRDTTLADYPLYDITCSPITSGVYDVTKKNEKENPLRIPGSLLTENNYARISVIGNKQERSIQVAWYNGKGTEVFRYEIPLKTLKKSKVGK